jgi:predicted Zn-dependent protease with MMP-like domain
MHLFTRADYDAALVEAIDDVPAWTLAALGDVVIRVEESPLSGGLETVPGLRLVVYRQPSLSQARDADELGRLVRADLVRAIVWQLDLADEHAHELSLELVAS